MIAKLRVGWMVPGCAPGVRTMDKRLRFHSTTGFAESAVVLGVRIATCACIVALTSIRVKTALIMLRSLSFLSDGINGRFLAAIAALSSVQLSILGGREKYSRAGYYFFQRRQYPSNKRGTVRVFGPREQIGENVGIGLYARVSTRITFRDRAQTRSVRQHSNPKLPNKPCAIASNVLR
jgi:hypothetical protein